MGESATTEAPAADLSPSPSPDAPKGAAASETVANGLYIRFFAGPAIKERLWAVRFGKRHQLAGLIGGEEPRGDLIHFRDGANLFDINADIAALGEGVDGEVAAVRRIEAESVDRILQRWFALRPVGKLDLPGGHL